MIEADGWNNHEDTFEEALRRELLEAKGTIFLLQDDIKQLTEAYYTVLKENENVSRVKAVNVLRKKQQVLLASSISKSD